MKSSPHNSRLAQVYSLNTCLVCFKQLVRPFALALLCAAMGLSSSAYGHMKVVVIPLLGDDADPNLIPENICHGVTISGTTGTAQCNSTFPPAQVTCNDINPITELTMVWDGPNGVNVVAEGGEVFPNVQKGGQITFGTVGLGSDVDLTLSGSTTGESRFHISCSDTGMNGTEDCSNHQGDGKDNSSAFNNEWLLGIMKGANGQFDCSLYPNLP